MKAMHERHLAILRRHMVEKIEIHSDLMEDELGAAALDKRVLTAMVKVPRNLFVPAPLQQVAYEDAPLLIGFNKSAPSRRLWHALLDVDRYLRGQSSWLVNYANRYRAGLRVGTSITEGTANFLVNRRMNKSQQMRWPRRGADLLLQVRCAVYNGTLGSELGHRFQPHANQNERLANAA